jgi:uncharacterized protein YqjF (DUF2071 family)
MYKIFLTAAWKNLIMANYEVDPSVLLPYVPAHTELDTFGGKSYVSLVGFLFDKVRIKGIGIPFHTRFPEVNLRFYVKQKGLDGPAKRGVVFISEVVPKPAIAWVANTLYREKYSCCRMKYSADREPGRLLLSYSWKGRGKQYTIASTVGTTTTVIAPGSMEEFIFEHYFGYAGVTKNITNLYAVEHPRWELFPVLDYRVTGDFQAFYGPAFGFMDQVRPDSVLVAAGSDVLIREKTVLR